MKCKFLRLSLLCLLFLFVFCINVSFASVNLSNFQQYNYNGNRTDFTDYLFNYFLNKNLSNYRDALNQSNQSTLSRFDTFISRFNDNITYPCIYWYTEKNSNNYNDITLYLHLGNNDFSSTQRYSFYKLKSQSIYNIVLSSSTGSETIDGNLSNTYANKYIFYNNNYYIANNSPIIPPILITNLTFNTEKTNTIEVHYSGDTENFIKADYSRDTDTWLLGNFTNVIDSGAVEIYGQLAAYQGSSDVGAIYSDVIASFQWKKDVGLFNNGLVLLEDSNYNVRVVNSRIYYNQGYCLYFNAYDVNRVELPIENQYTYLYFVPYGSTATSGELINPQANTNLDWNFINSIEHLYDSPSGNTAFIFNNYNTSGDILGFTYSDYDQWGFGDFIKYSFNNFLDALYDYTDTSFDLGILGVHNSSEFIVSNNALITIVSLFSNCFLLLSSIAWFFYTICAIGVLDLDKIIKDKADLGLF